MTRERERIPSRERERIEDRLARRGGTTELLRIPAAAFAALSSARACAYDRGWLRSARVDAAVVSVGNLTAGGTGKTPMVAWIARELARRGRRVGILSRGYRARAGEASDEGRLLAELAPGAERVEDADRVRGAHALIERGADAIVLDDGFQHRRLARDLDLALVDATRPWGLAGWRASEAPLLPRGLLRERPRALARAHAIVLTRADQASQADLVELRGEIEALAPGVAIACAAHRPVALRSLDGAACELGQLSGARVDLVSGLAHPEAFERTVRGLGASVGEHRRFPDHHAYAAGDLDRLAATIVTSAKDAVKLRALGLAARVLVLDVEIEIVDGAPALAALLDALPTSRAQRERAAIHEGLHG